MKQLHRLLVSLVVPAFMLAGVVASPSFAQDKAKDAKAAPAAKAAKGAVAINVVFDNDKVRAQEVTYKPGDENKNVARDGRVVRALTTGTLQRTYPDGKSTKIEFKAGDVIYNDPVVGTTPQYTTKNIGKSDLVLYVVILKGTSQPTPPNK